MDLKGKARMPAVKMRVESLRLLISASVKEQSADKGQAVKADCCGRWPEKRCKANQSSRMQPARLQFELPSSL